MKEIYLSHKLKKKIYHINLLYCYDLSTGSSRKAGDI